jgi:hypothetical protein
LIKENLIEINTQINFQALKSKENLTADKFYPQNLSIKNYIREPYYRKKGSGMLIPPTPSYKLL